MSETDSEIFRNNYTVNQKTLLLHPICEKHTTILTIKKGKVNLRLRSILLYYAKVFSRKMSYQVSKSATFSYIKLIYPYF